MTNQPIIWAMAKAQYEHDAGHHAFDLLPLPFRELLYDKMHAALKKLRDPTEDMCQALEFGPVPDLDQLNGTCKAIWAPAWTAAIDKLLEVTNDQEAHPEA